ncbi:S-locus-specific glycoprotein S6-like [Lolium rigidum]|uniref:S-locus-specific glycoprotein S6-like n=1 Tax=Lolium rigidum TaxID=89674 RepID=UPI001F5D1902|nr:S-locus-specific glycoprotein S6-like [Lolium rigidum]
MRPTRQLLSLLFLLQCIFLLPIQTSAVDKLEKGQNLTDGETLVSAGGTFTLGFFSPGVSTKKYLGIWFSESNDTVYWVANRDDPLGDGSGMLVFNNEGSLVLLGASGRSVWSSDFVGSATAPVAQLVESGNLVVRNGTSDASLWQSFDHPCDTLLPGMKLGKNFWSGDKWVLTSWRSADDPTSGDYIRTLEATRSSGLPELVLWHNGVKTFRTGPWNGRWFNGAPEASTFSDKYQLHVDTSATETTYGYTASPDAPLTRVVVNHTGVAQRLVWDASSRAWISFFKGPKGDCDAYAHCGAFGLCNGTAVSVCGCVPGFVPATSSAWQLKQYAGGCRRNEVLDCRGGTSTDRFKLVPGVKLPDTHNASVDTGITLEECKARCYANCSCLAYAAAYTQESGDGTGCIIWADTIVDIRLLDRGQNLYLRLSKSEFDDPIDGKRFPILLVVAPIASLASALTVLLVIFLIRWRMRRRIIGAISQNPSMAVLSVNLATIKHVTKSFSEDNRIGEGRFANVYQAQLAEGRTIAVKRLKQSALTRKGNRYFAREVEARAGLRHESLVRLLAYCNQGKERILVYEYMEHNSLDVYIFGSGESVIHGDLKPGNILLDNEWIPKIANFGTAKLLAVDQMGHGQTILVSTGYASPEYEQAGDMTLKCDIYSFGIIILETLCGRRNNEIKSLLEHVSKPWQRNNVMELFNEMGLPLPESDSEVLFKLERCIETALRCIRDSPDNRPPMSDIVYMLTNIPSYVNLTRHQTGDSMFTSKSRESGEAGPSSSDVNCLRPSINQADVD